MFWFMSLVFSLTAVLATQQLAVGSQCMASRSKTTLSGVPRCESSSTKASLALDSRTLSRTIFRVNTATATTTVITIALCAVLHPWCIIALVYDYQSPLSGIF